MESTLGKIKDYFRGAISEMKKVSWPTRKQVANYSIVVIIMSIGIAIFFGILDYLLNLGLTALIS